jgi:hypothetical protein
MTDQPLKKFLATRVETVTVVARNEDDAQLMASEALDFVGAETTDLQVEEQEG